MGIKIDQINQVDSQGKARGIWRHKARCGGHFEGYCVKGNLQGLWRYWDAKGQLMWRRYYLKGTREGEKIEYGYRD